jgi:hypothetical protein
LIVLLIKITPFITSAVVHEVSANLIKSLSRAHETLNTWPDHRALQISRPPWLMDAIIYQECPSDMRYQLSMTSFLWQAASWSMMKTSIARIYYNRYA